MRPLGFTINNRQLARAGLDYGDLAAVVIHDNWQACLASFGTRRLFAVTTRGSQRYDLAQYAPGDVFVFGPETRGFPAEVLDPFPSQHRIRVPMRAGNRSLNLSNAIAVVVYEAWRQNDFADSVTTR